MANLRLAAAAPELLQRTIAAEKQAQSERERADKADAEIARLKERVKELKGALIAKDGIALLAQSNKEG
jgi:DNA-binding protein H-NS